MVVENFMIMAMSTAFGIAVALPIFVWSEWYREYIIRYYQSKDMIWSE